MILEQNQSDRLALMAALLAGAGWANWQEKYPEKEARLRRILSSMQIAQFPGAVIPRLMKGRMVYYAVSDSGKQWRLLQGLLRAFIGTTLTDFQGLPTDLDSADPFEMLLATQVTGPVGRFSPGGVKYLEQAAVDALVRMVLLTEGEGKAQRSVPPSTRYLLSEFRLALAAGNDVAAGEALAYLRTQMRLDSLNLFCLEVERFQTRQDWAGLVAAPFFPALVDARRPPKVTRALLQALYHTQVAPAVAAGDLNSILSAVRHRVSIPYGPLLKSLPPNPDAGIALLFLAEAHFGMDSGAPVVTLAREELHDYPVAERAVVRAILEALVPAAVPLTSQESSSPTPQGALAAVFTALEAGSLTALQEALAYMDRFSAPEREALVRQRAFGTLWKELTSVSRELRVPGSWVEFLSALPHMRFPEVRALAERAQVEWVISEQLRAPGDVSTLAQAVQEAWTSATHEVTTLLPYLVEWVTRDESWPNPLCLPLYEVLLLCLNLSDQHGQGLLDAVSTLLNGCLRIGLSRKAYQELLKDIGDRAAAVAGLNTVDWVLDLGEQVLIQPCPDSEARAAFWLRLQTALAPVRPRLKEEQTALLVFISQALGVEPLPTPKLDLSGPAARLAPTGMLALYTLQTSVAQRVEAIMSQVAPGLDLQICTDTVATERLRHLARTADQFVVCWQDAKHAATQEICRLRPPQRPVLWAAGGGSSGVLRALRGLWVT